MNQLTTTNKHFTVETSIMEKIFDASGYHFHVLTIDGHKCWILKELAHAFGYSKASNMLQAMGKNTNRIRLTKNKRGEGIPNTISLAGLTELKKILMDSDVFLKKTSKTCWTERNIEKTHIITLIREDTLQEFLTLYARKPDAKEIGKILYEVLTSGKTLVEVFEEEKNPVLDLLNTELESNEFGSKFNTWYKEKINKCSYFWKWDKKNQLYNWQKSLIGLRMTLGSRFLKVAGKNSAKKVLKEQGASSKLTKSNRTIARSFDPASSDQMLFLPILTTKSTSIQFAESTDSSSSFYNFYTI